MMPGPHRGDPAELRALYDDQMRRNVVLAGCRVVRDDRLVRVEEEGHHHIEWSDLADADLDVDAIIAEQVAAARASGVGLGWKYFDYDQPPDLERRLIAAGFTRDEDETLMIASSSSYSGYSPADLPAALPGDVRIEQVDVMSDSSLQRFLDVHAAVFDSDVGPNAQAAGAADAAEARFCATVRAHPEFHLLFVAVVGEMPVSAARLELPVAASFAGLWGGGTLPEWRGRGIYRALVSHRAAIAAARGVPYLTVDASSESRPILERLGFLPVARTTPYELAL